jgi:solute carrier family 35 protein E3
MHARVFIAAVGSVLSSTGIVFLNKWLFAFDDFSFPATLTGWHLITTHLVLACALRLSIFTRKGLSWRVKLWFSVLDAVAMALQNLSLNRNSVNFYQTCKLCTVPVIVMIEKVLGKPLPNAHTMLVLSVITLGVGLSTGANFDSNSVGVVIGLGATLSTALVIVATTWLQKLHDLSSTQLLHNIAILDGSLLVVFGPALDYHLSSRVLYVDYKWTSESRMVFGLTCVMAVLVNCITFYLLGKVSPVSYQVIGQAKTVIIYGVGYYFFDREVSHRANVGALVALFGCLVYARITLTHSDDRNVSKRRASEREDEQGM